MRTKLDKKKQMKWNLCFSKEKREEIERKRKKFIWATPSVHRQHAPMHWQALGVPLQTSSWKAMFGHWRSPRVVKGCMLLPLVGACIAHVINFFVLSFVFFLKTKLTSIQLDNNKKNQEKKTEKLLDNNYRIFFLEG
jgi:hypothetical protein